MTVKDYVVSVVESYAKYRVINVGEEVWNILYNLLHDFNVKHSDLRKGLNEAALGYIDGREMEFHNYYAELKKA